MRCKTETLAVVRDFTFLMERQTVLKLFALSFYKNVYFSYYFQNFWSTISMVNVQITTNCSVLTYSIFVARFARFDESVDCIGGRKPW